MTPKEKAIGLYDKYATYAVMWAGDSKTTKENCKQCALICVDEIIKDMEILLISYQSSTYKIGFGISDRFNYWQEVKQEINKL